MTGIAVPLILQNRRTALLEAAFAHAAERGVAALSGNVGETANDPRVIESRFRSSGKH